MAAIHKNLFHDDRLQPPTNTDESSEESGPEITSSEVVFAIKKQNNGKAPGPDNIFAECLKILAENDSDGLQMLTDLFNRIYKSGKIPNEWLKSIFVAIPKKPKSESCDDYRIISLMSHVLKIFLRNEPLILKTY